MDNNLLFLFCLFAALMFGMFVIGLYVGRTTQTGEPFKDWKVKNGIAIPAWSKKDEEEYLKVIQIDPKILAKAAGDVLESHE